MARPYHPHCIICGVFKTEENTYVTQAGNLFPRCKSCKNKERIANRKQAGKRDLNTARLRKYNLCAEGYALMLRKQDNKCAICRCEESEAGHQGWHVDHCHTTGVVRGILCRKCNVGLGHFKDSSKLLLNASLYIEANKWETVEK